MIEYFKYPRICNIAKAIYVKRATNAIEGENKDEPRTINHVQGT